MRKKRSASAPNLNVTLESRLHLKRSIEDGSISVYDSSLKRNRTLEELTRETLTSSEEIKALFSNCRLLGSGSYGQVHLLESSSKTSPAVVAKVVSCSSILLGDPVSDPFRSEHVEPRIMHFLWNMFVGSTAKVTPHLMAPVGTHHLVSWISEEQRKTDVDATMSAVHYMEFATDTVLRYYFAPLTQAEFNLHFRVVFFQVCYTLAAIHLKFPNFRHNDLKDDNICMHTTDKGGYYKYVFGDSHTFFVPRIGVIPIIGDFDFACIAGQLMDNYKTLEQQWQTPTLCIGVDEDQGADIWSLVANIRQRYDSRFQRWITEELNELFGPQKKKHYNSNRRMHYDLDATATEVLLSSALFEDFVLESPPDALQVHETYIALGDQVMHRQRIEGVYSFKRFCPLFYARSEDVENAINLPSRQYYLTHGTAANEMIEQENTVAYVQIEGNRLIERMSPLFCTEFEFDLNRKDEFLKNVKALAAQFLNTFAVPMRWWPAAFTCAWMDTALKMGLYEPEESTWATEDWVEWWQVEGHVTYSEMQLLHFHLQWSWWKKAVNEKE